MWIQLYVSDVYFRLGLTAPLSLDGPTERDRKLTTALRAALEPHGVFESDAELNKRSVEQCIFASGCRVHFWRMISFACYHSELLILWLLKSVCLTLVLVYIMSLVLAHVRSLLMAHIRSLVLRYVRSLVLVHISKVVGVGTCKVLGDNICKGIFIIAEWQCCWKLIRWLKSGFRSAVLRRFVWLVLCHLVYYGSLNGVRVCHTI